METTIAAIEAAHARIAECRQAAATAALLARDLHDCVKFGVHAPGDPEVRAAEDTAHRAMKALEMARGALLQLERERDRQQIEAHARAADAERARRRAWVGTNRPALIEDLHAAEAEEQRLRATPFVHDSSSGQAALAAIGRRVQRARQAIEQAAARAPAQEVTA